MSKVDTLIREKCPNGVEYKKISEVFDMLSSMTGVSKKWEKEGNCRFIDYMNVYKNIKVNVNILPFATVKNLNQTVLKTGDLLLTSASETPDECAISSVVEDKIEDGIFIDDHLFGLRLKKEYENTINPVFINYYLNAFPFRKNLSKAVRGVTRFYIASEKYMNLLVAIPPIEVQNEIIQILDKFGELEAELEARKSQYEFWHGKLFEDLDKKFKKVKFKEFATITRGGNFQKKDYVDDGKPCLHYGQIYTYFGPYTDKVLTYIPQNIYDKQRIAKTNDVIMAVTSENYEDVCKSVAWIGKEEIAVSGHSAIISSNQNAKYLSYYFSSSVFQKEKVRFARGVKVIEFPPEKLNEIGIALPPLDIQNKVVNILDRFDRLINDISEGLPAEIEKRRKQYEYYRDQLLSF